MTYTIVEKQMQTLLIFTTEGRIFITFRININFIYKVSSFIESQNFLLTRQLLSLHLFCHSGKKAAKIEALRHWSKLQFRKFRRVFIGFHSVSYLEPWLHYLHSFSDETLQMLLYLAAAFAFWLSTTLWHLNFPGL